MPARMGAGAAAKAIAKQRANKLGAEDTMETASLFEGRDAWRARREALMIQYKKREKLDDIRCTAMAIVDELEHAGPKETKEPPTDEELLARQHEINRRALLNPKGFLGPTLNPIIKFCQGQANGTYYNMLVLICIIMAGVLVGMQSYKNMSENASLAVLDNVILYIFLSECIIKMVAEGNRPWRYFVGPEWAWNNFDFIIVMACMPWPGMDAGSSVAFLRLLRLMRLLKLVRKVKKLQVIVMGLVKGLSSVSYIMILMILIFYLFAVMGVYNFRENDPGHFGNLGVAMLTLFRCSTLEDWTDVMYINMYGCEAYDTGLYFPAKNLTGFDTVLGYFPEFACYAPQPQMVLSVVYFVFFILIAAFVMLSLFVGAVCGGMSEALDQMTEMEDKAKQKKAEKAKEEEEERKMLELENPKAAQEENNLFGDNTEADEMYEERRLNKLVTRAWQGQEKRLYDYEEGHEIHGPLHQYLILADYFRILSINGTFNSFVTFVICCAGILVGIGTEIPSEENKLMADLDMIILVIFTVECTVKIIGEGMKPLHYFHDAWNKFDFFIVAATWIPLLLKLNFGSIVSMLRLLRLLRVLKLVKALPQLRIIIEALISGLGSIGFVTIILFMFFYLFGIGGMLFFGPNHATGEQGNDPYHWKDLHTALITLFRAATLDDWTDLMYTAMYGCERYGYDGMEELCTDSNAMGWMGAIFFVIFTVLGSLVLLTLFIGIVATSMDSAKADQEEEKQMEDRTKRICEELDITIKSLGLFKELFDSLCDEEETSLSLQNMRPVLNTILLSDPFEPQQQATPAQDEKEGHTPSVDDRFTESEMQVCFLTIDSNGNGRIELDEFLFFMELIRQCKKDAELLSEFRSALKTFEQAETKKTKAVTAAAAKARGVAGASTVLDQEARTAPQLDPVLVDILSDMEKCKLTITRLQDELKREKNPKKLSAKAKAKAMALEADEEDDDEQADDIVKLKRRNKKLEKENSRLRDDVAMLEAAIKEQNTNEMA